MFINKNIHIFNEQDDAYTHKEIYTSGYSDKIYKHSRQILNELVDYISNNTFSSDIHKKLFDIILKGLVKKFKSKCGCLCLNRPSKSEDGGTKIECISITTKKHFKNLDNLIYFNFVGNDDVNVISDNIYKDTRFVGANLKEGGIIKKIIIIPLFCNKVNIGKFIFFNPKMKCALKNIELIKKASLLFFVTTKIIYNYELIVVDEKKSEKQMTELKHSFIATMSHEIKTPLSGMIGLISLLENAGPLNDKQKEYLKRILVCCEQLMNILMDILDYSKIKSGALVLKHASFNLNECCKYCIDIYQSKINERKLNFHFENDIDVHTIVYGDEKRLKQIIINLLSNAIKFTHTGGNVYFKISKVENENTNVERIKNAGDNKRIECVENEIKIKFSIEDDGIGIEPKDQQRILNVFEQVDHSNLNKSNRKRENDINNSTGTGMGLTISNELLNLMDSKLEIYSRGLETGSTFSFDINFQLEIVNTQNNINILIVENDIDNKITLSSMMFKWKIHNTICNSHQEAIHYLNLDNTKFNLIIINVENIGIGGIELAQTIKQKYNIPLIGIFSEHEKHNGKIWFNYCIHGKLNSNELYKNIINLTQSHIINRAKKTNKSIKTLSTLKICIAEDNEVNQYFLVEMLKTIGVNSNNIIVCNDGEECVDKLKTKYVDIVFMDLKMPKMDGISASKIIKRMKYTPSIIIVSASILDKDKEECSKIGIDAYLSKPYKLSDLKNIIDQYAITPL